MVGIVVIGLLRLNQASRITDRVISQDGATSVIANEIVDLANDSIQSDMQLLLLTDPEKISKTLEHLDANEETISDKLELLNKSLNSEEGKAIFEKIQESRAEYLASFSQVSSLISDDGNRQEAVRIMLDETLKTLHTYVETIKDLSKLQAKTMARAGREARDDYAFGRRVMIGLGGVALILGAAFAFWVTRSINRPLKIAVDVARQIAQGDMTAKIKVTSRDETGQLLEAMRHMVQTLNEMACAAERVSAGDLNGTIEARCENDMLGKSFHNLQETIQALIAETNQLTQWSQNGQLDKRGDASRFRGGYRELVEGINRTLDAVTTPINEASTVLEAVASRDLSHRMQGDYKGDFAKIKEAINTAVGNLDAVLTQVSVGSREVTWAAEEISKESQTLAQGASEQADSLEKISKSLQGMASISARNVGNAKEAKLQADGTRLSVEQGVESMERLSEAIDRIKQSADSTAKIIKTIDEIAFQTNLLALNAAVEAARAGESGRGFAVVAEEVRSLALRSAEAARNSADLIEGSVKKAEDGVAINQEVLGKLKQINQQVQKVNDVISEIASASEQQNDGVRQVNTAMEQMNNVTRQTAAISEKSASAAEELSGHSQETLGLISSFLLTESKPMKRGTDKTKEIVASTLASKRDPKALESNIALLARQNSRIPADNPRSTSLKIG